MARIPILALLMLGNLCPGLFGQERKEASAASGRTIVPLVILGEGWSQQIVVTNADGDGRSLTGTLKFFRADGSPWRVPLRDRSTDSEFFVTLRPGELAIYETVVDEGPQALGFAELDVSCCARYLAQTLFRKQTPARPDLMTSMPLDDSGFRSVYIPFDNRDGKYAGVGILNLD